MRSERRRPPFGFTLTEVMVALVVVGVMTGVSYGVMSRFKPRAAFRGIGAEIKSLIHQARQQALASGVPVAVLLFPNYQETGFQGRLVLVQDSSVPASSLFNAAATVNFDNYDPSRPANPDCSSASHCPDVSILNLPQNVTVGPSTGFGTAALVFPYNRITTNVACSFCKSTGDQRGAIVFDDHGHATFYSGAATVSGGVGGASFSIQGADLGNASVITFVVTAITGSVTTFQQ